MLKGYLVKLGYQYEFFFDNIMDASAFFHRALIHSKEDLKWAVMEPVFYHPEQDVNEEEKNDAEKTDCKEDPHAED